MSTISQHPVTRAPERPWAALFTATEMWAGIAIAVIWIAVLFTGVYGPDILSRGAAGDGSTIPSVVPVALFASLATWAVAKYAFGRDSRR